MGELMRGPFRKIALFVFAWSATAWPCLACVQEDDPPTEQDIYRLERNGTSLSELTEARCAAANALLGQWPEDENERTQRWDLALKLLQPSLDSMPRLLESDEASKLAIETAALGMNLATRLNRFDETRGIAASFLNYLSDANSLSDQARLIAEARIRINASDVSFADESWDYSLGQLEKVLVLKDKLLESKEGVSQFTQATIQSIRHLGSANRPESIRAVATRGIEALEQSKMFAEDKRCWEIAYLIDQALDFTSAEACPSDVEYWANEAIATRKQLIEADDDKLGWVIGELWNHEVNHALRKSVGEANQVLADFRAWLKTRDPQATINDRAIDSFIAATVFVLKTPEVVGEDFALAFRGATELFDELEFALGPDSEHVARIRKSFDGDVCALAGKIRGPLVGHAAPASHFVRVADGTEFDLADLRGKVVLLDFWNTRCGPCIKSFPHLAELKEKFNDRGLEIVGCTFFYTDLIEAAKDGENAQPVDRQEALAYLRDFAARHKVRHSLVVATEFATERDFVVLGHPTAVLIDRDGFVRSVHEGLEGIESPELVTAIEELLDK